MAIKIETLESAELVQMIRLDRKLYLNAARDKVVEPGDPEAAFLYGIEGHLKPKKEAEALGALPKPKQKAPQPKVEEPPTPKEPVDEGKTEDKEEDKGEEKQVDDKGKSRRAAPNKQAPKPADK